MPGHQIGIVLDHIERGLRHNHHIPVADRDAGHEPLPFLPDQILLVGDQDLGVGIELRGLPPEVESAIRLYGVKSRSIIRTPRQRLSVPPAMTEARQAPSPVQPLSIWFQTGTLPPPAMPAPEAAATAADLPGDSSAVSARSVPA